MSETNKWQNIDILKNMQKHIANQSIGDIKAIRQKIHVMHKMGLIDDPDCLFKLDEEIEKIERML